MTIAAGFVCADGILLASDTLYSGTGQGYKLGRKFWTFDHGDVLVCFGGAGTEGGLLRTRDEIARKLRSGMSRIRAVDTIDGALMKVAQKLPDDPAYKTQALVVVRVDGEIVLYENSGGTNMLSPVQQPCQCVGYAQALGWYFASSLFREGMSLKWAKIVAAHLVKNVKQYSEYCGGDTHIVEVRATGDTVSLDDKAEIASLEQYLADIEGAMRLVLPVHGSYDPRHEEDTLAYRRDSLRDAILKADGIYGHQKHVGPGPGFSFTVGKPEPKRRPE